MTGRCAVKQPPDCAAQHAGAKRQRETDRQPWVDDDGTAQPEEP